jgi:hypothetical protein
VPNDRTGVDHILTSIRMDGKSNGKPAQTALREHGG